MYHCHIQFYFVGSSDQLLEVVRELPPLDHFSHTFSSSEKPDRELAEKADVIFVNLTGYIFWLRARKRLVN